MLSPESCHHSSRGQIFSDDTPAAIERLSPSCPFPRLTLFQSASVRFHSRLFFVRGVTKQLGTDGGRGSVEVLWEIAKVETTLRNGRHAAKRRSASPSRRRTRRRRRRNSTFEHYAPRSEGKVAIGREKESVLSLRTDIRDSRIAADSRLLLAFRHPDMVRA